MFILHYGYYGGVYTGIAQGCTKTVWDQKTYIITHHDQCQAIPTTNWLWDTESHALAMYMYIVR